MSTAYPPRFMRYMLSSQRERDVARTAPIDPGVYGDFPPAFGLYYSMPGPDYLSQIFTLSTIAAGGNRKDILYKLIFHKGPGARQMTLYSGPNSNVPLVVGRNQRRFGSSAVLKLPGARTRDEPWTESLQYNGIGSNIYAFEFDGNVYEWHEDKTTRPRTRRLQINHSGNEVWDPDHDGVLATWTEGSVPNRQRQLAVFRFVGRGISDQKLDGRWMLLAVSTALIICQQGAAIEGTMTWHEEKLLERGAHLR